MRRPNMNGSKKLSILTYSFVILAVVVVILLFSYLAQQRNRTSIDFHNQEDVSEANVSF